MIPYILSHRELKTIVPGTLTVAAFDKFYPLAFWKNGKADGVEIRLMTEYAAVCGLKIKFIRVHDFTDIWDKPLKGEADISIGGIANARGRTHPGTEWTIPYYYVKRSIIVRKKTNGTRNTQLGADIKTIVATKGSTGEIDSMIRDSELMNSKLKSAKGVQDLDRLRAKKIDGIMYGDEVAHSVLAADRKKTKKNDLTMITWDIVPNLVPLDGETFSFPTKLGSGIAVSLTAFLIDAMHTGRIRRLCREFSIRFPPEMPQNRYPIIPFSKKNPHLRRVLREFLKMPEAPSQIKELFKTVSRVLADFHTGGKFHENYRDRTLMQLKSTRIEVDHSVVMDMVTMGMRETSRITTGIWKNEPDKWIWNKEHTNCMGCGDSEMFEFIKYEGTRGDETLFTYKGNICTINTQKVMAHVRDRGNTLKALEAVGFELIKEIMVAVVERESGIKSLKSLLKIE